MSSAIASVKAADQNLKDAIASAQDGLDDLRISTEQSLSSAESKVRSSHNSWQSSKDQLARLKTPATAQDLEISRAQVITAEAQYGQAKNNYDNNVITAPFDGQIAAINIQKGDEVTPSTVVATIITRQQVATVTMNEVDVAKIKIGDKAVMTFDAIDGLSISGKVGEIDTTGTVSQNVVTYGVKISMDVQDDRIRPGMSANVEIITDARIDVLAVPNQAVKSDSRGSYVQILDAGGKPQRADILIGAANDSYTEVTVGLKEGDNVIIQTIDQNVRSKTSVQTQQGGAGIRIPGFGGGGR
jgi:HlyD family secretion protein